MPVRLLHRLLRRLRPRSALASARFDFADALADISAPQAGGVVNRIVATRSLHDLWHFRAEIFHLVACQHDQAEAARRLRRLNRHAPGKPRRRAARAAPPDAPC